MLESNRDQMFATEPDVSDLEQSVVTILAGLIDRILNGEVDVRNLNTEREVLEYHGYDGITGGVGTGPTTLTLVYQ